MTGAGANGSILRASLLLRRGVRIDRDSSRLYTLGYPQQCGQCPEGHGGDTRKRKAVGLHSPKGGEAYAYYSDIPCVWLYHHTESYEEKQQPPLWPVTVVFKITI